MFLPQPLPDFFWISIRVGTDSLIGLIASISMSCTETIFYTMSVYDLKIKNSRYTLTGPLIATPSPDLQPACSLLNSCCNRLFCRFEYDTLMVDIGGVLMASITRKSEQDISQQFVSVKNLSLHIEDGEFVTFFRPKRLRKIHHTSHDRWYGGYYIR